MKSILSEKSIVAVLFVLVLITFSLAQEDSKKIEQFYLGTSAGIIKPSPIVKNAEFVKDNRLTTASFKQ